MRNENSFKIRKIISLVKNLPYFSFNNLSGIENDRTYLKILFSRYKKSGKLIRLKRGVYVTKDYVDKLEKMNKISIYTEFLSSILYEPSYLSLEYVLYQNNLITEIPKNFTLITKKKTIIFSNFFGNFIYHKIKNELFCGFEVFKENDFIIYKAKKSKALFDFLYLRKRNILNKKMFEELRLNLDELTKIDKEELLEFINLEGSKKMKEILNYIF
jgi:predicted transcriptional regulator of viral defense system